jgi:uncharacterized OsmC-like protein
MTDDLIVQTAVSQNTLVYGRTLNSARQHHFIIDGTREPNEEVTPVEVFLSAVSACCVQWVEQFAREDGVDLSKIEVTISGTRLATETNRFQFVEVWVRGRGVSQSQLEDFVAKFTERCPLYRTVAAATEVRITVSAS